jgi:transmembrane sensor
VTPSDDQIRAAIAEQANEWLVENRSGPLDREARARFMTWLRSSPVHVREYFAIAGLAHDLRAAAKATGIQLEPLLARARAEVDRIAALDSSFSASALAARPRRLPRVRLLAAAATLVCVATAAVWMLRDGERFGLPRTYSTAHGEQIARVLPDGSVLRLNTDSDVTVRYSRGERLVSLDRGQAFFEVTHEVRRGFRVTARNAQILDLGTQFDVYRKSDAVQVTVVEGTVAVYTGPPQLLPTAPRLAAGYQVEVRDRVGTPRALGARAAVAWLTRQIAFEDRPLGEVAEEFSRYGHIAIEIDDVALRSLPITGEFDAYDIDSFVAFLSTLSDVVVQKTSTHIRIRSRASAPPEPLPGTR